MLVTGDFYNTTQLIVLNIIMWIVILGFFAVIISLIIYGIICIIKFFKNRKSRGNYGRQKQTKNILK